MAVNKFFNAEYYLATNVDLIRAGLHTDEQLWNHYEQYGALEAAAAGDGETRAPNPWFNVNYYMQANPDLNAAGLTAADALNHYETYGIFEGREFSATVSASQFDAETYVEENADVAAAFGIVEGAELTAANKADLLGHYLAYGYIEGREGAGDIADFVQADNEISIANSNAFTNDVALGTIMNDKFVVTNTDAADTQDQVIDGLGGDNTVVFKTTQTSAANAEAVTLKNIQNVVVDGFDVEFNATTKINNITLNDAADAADIDDFEVNAQLAAAAVAGSADVLNVVNNAGTVDTTTPANSTAATLNVNGYETVNLALGEEVGEFTLNANSAKGATLAVNLTGGSDTSALILGSDNSTSVKTVKIDGSGFDVGFGEDTVTLAESGDGDQIQNVTTVEVIGSADKANVFNTDAFGLTTADTTKTVSVTGGSKADTFSTTEAIDILTGGKGDDEFTIAASSSDVRLSTDNKSIEAMDTITDFKKGDSVTIDTVTLTETNILTGTGTAIETEAEFLSFLTTGSDNTVFQYGSDAYILVAAGTETDGVFTAGPELVKLTGVNVNNLTVDSGNLVYEA